MDRLNDGARDPPGLFPRRNCASRRIAFRQAFAPPRIGVSRVMWSASSCNPMRNVMTNVPTTGAGRPICPPWPEAKASAAGRSSEGRTTAASPSRAMIPGMPATNRRADNSEVGNQRSRGVRGHCADSYDCSGITRARIFSWSPSWRFLLPERVSDAG